MNELETLAFYAQIAKHLASISANISALSETYASVQERSALDESLIDVLASKADEMKAAAIALKSINYSG